jgi:RND superfamily putative drug exporter
MALLGDWNWWAPQWLRRLHNRIGLNEAGVDRSVEPLTEGVALDP